MDILQTKVNLQNFSRVLSDFANRNIIVGSLQDDKIYTNEEIKNNFLTVIQEQDTFKNHKHIISLIQTDKIIAAHIQPGLLTRLMFELYKKKRRFAQSNFSLAFYNFKTNKIYMLIEKINNTGYWKKEESLSLILLHELQHMTAVNFPDQFIHEHKNSLSRYYQSFIKSYFNADISLDDALQLSMWLNKNFELQTRNVTIKQVFDDYFSILWDLLKPYSKNNQTLTSDLKEFFKIVMTYLHNPTDYLKLLHSRDKKAFSLYLALKDAYDNLNCHNIDTVCIQECFFPSEVICVESEYNTQPQHFKLIEKIR